MADDPVAVAGVDLVQIDAALDQACVVLLDGLRERRGTAGVVGVGLDAAQQGRQHLPAGLLGGLRVHAELAASWLIGTGRHVLD